jgi:putative tryptophan/tyrosine transport system substrate-binding protein
MKKYFFLTLFFFISACESSNTDSQQSIPVIGFVDMFKDETIDLARQGFYAALTANGFKPDSSIKIIYRNAQNDQPTLLQAIDYCISQNVKMIATNTTIPTISAVQKTNSLPVCMMVAPSPKLAGLLDENGNAPANLFGVYDTLAYIDTAFSLIKSVMPNVKKVGLIFDQSEPQSNDALKELQLNCTKNNIELEALPVNNSSETQTVMQALVLKRIDAFFALPDNTIFASFETVVKSCSDMGIPIFTSEAGLVKRGAVAGFGADLYQWGYQAGLQAAQYLKQNSLDGLKPEYLKKRIKMYNPKVNAAFHFHFDSSFTAVK